ncbi:MAG: GAF domain-containing SpoIIE family protein phosphatase [Janthinobacterium lividum]
MEEYVVKESLLTDPERLAALEETELLDSPAEYVFDRFTQLAGQLLQTPIVLVSLVTEERQFFKSSVGPSEVLPESRETPLSHSLCRYVVETAKPFIIFDTLDDPDLRDTPVVTELGVRAYAGIPLVTADGHILGSFCAIDVQPHQWTEAELTVLRTLAEAVQTEIELRTALIRAQQQAQKAEQARRETAALLESTAEGIYGIDRNGICTFLNSSAARMLGYTADEVLGRNVHQLIHHHYPDGREYPLEECAISLAVSPGIGQRIEGDVFWRSDGSSFPVSFYASPLLENGVSVGAVIAFSDITTRRETEARVLAAWERDRHVAEALQRAILPEVPEYAFAGLAVATRYQAARQEARVGGDFFDAFAVDEGRIAFAVGDASGKGLAAAVRTAEAKFALRAFLREDPAPGMALTRLNNLLCASQRLEARDDDTFIVMTLAVVDIATGSALFATAGAEPPLILRADGSIDEVLTRGVPLGFLAPQQYPEMEYFFDPGETLLLATDGITEARQGQDFLGYEGMAALAVSRHSSSDGPVPVQEIAQTILDGAQEFAGGKLHDDACLLLIRRL